IASWDGCGDKRDRDPWVVSNATFDDRRFQISLNAVKSTWKNVSHTMILDFGDFVPNSLSTDKRFLDISLNKAFTLDVSSQWPTEIAHVEIVKPYASAGLTLNCNGCGTTGTVVFAGHVEVGLFDGLKVFQLSATPHDVSANLNLEVIFQGEVDYVGV